MSRRKTARSSMRSGMEPLRQFLELDYLKQMDTPSPFR